MHLAALVGMIGYGDAKVDAERILSELPTLKSAYPQFPGLWLVSTYAHVEFGSVHEEVKRDEFLKARGELLIYMSRLKGSKADAENYLKQIDAVLTKLNGKDY